MGKRSVGLSKILSLILTAAMVATCMPAPVYALEMDADEVFNLLDDTVLEESVACDEVSIDEAEQIVCGSESEAYDSESISYGGEPIAYEGEPIAYEEDDDIEISYPDISADRYTADKAGDGYMNSGQAGVAKKTMKELAESMPVWGTGYSLYSREPVTSGSGYKTAVLTTNAYDYVKKYINYYRGAAGLGSISFTDELNDSAAWGALTLAMNDVFTHYPDKPADMSEADYNKGYAATTSSNLSYSGGYPESSVLTVAIDGQMKDDSGSNLTCLGHRRWLLRPGTANMGVGTASIPGSYGKKYYTDIRVFGEGVGSTSASDYDFISWPSSGNNLSDTFATNTPWSITLNPAKYSAPAQSSVVVKLESKKSGKSWTFNSSTSSTETSGTDFYTVDTGGYGVANCIIFRPGVVGQSEYSGEYTVSVSGLKDKAGNAASLSYKVVFDTYENAMNGSGGGSEDTVSTPTASAEGAVASGTEITITCETAGAEIYYTTDGSTPAVESGVPTGTTKKYTAPIKIEAAVTIKAIAIKAGKESDVMTKSYTIATGHTIGNVVWDIDDQGKLTVTGTGEFKAKSGDPAPWYNDRLSIKSAVVTLSGTKDFSHMFEDCTNLTRINMNGTDFSSAEDMSYMFCNSGAFWNYYYDPENPDESNKTSKVKNMSHMYEGVYVSDWDEAHLSFDTSGATDMSYMFANVKGFTLMFNNSDTSKVTNMSNMFAGVDVQAVYLELDTRSVTDMSSMFEDAKPTLYWTSGTWDTSKVTNMSRMFANSGAYNIEYDSGTPWGIPYTKFNTSNVENMSGMFEGCAASTLDLSNFNMSKVSNASDMFKDCDKLVHLYTPRNVKQTVELPTVFVEEGKETETEYSSLPKNQSSGKKLVNIAQVNFTVKEVNISPKTAAITLSGNSLNEKVVLTALVKPEMAKNKAVTWSASPAGSVVFSNENDNPVTVTALDEGKVTITVTTDDGNKTDAAILTIDRARVEAPVFTPAGGRYLQSQNVTLATETEGAKIYYTIDGSTPSKMSMLYSAPIRVGEGDVTIKAIAVKDGMKDSDFVSASYKIGVFWGDIDDPALRSMFGNDPSRIPGDIWYTVAGTDNFYTESGTVTFNNANRKIYTGSPITFNGDISVYYKNIRLWENRDYTVSYANNTIAASAESQKAPTFTVKAKGSYSGNAVFKFDINKAQINTASITSDKTVPIDAGKALNSVKPDVTLGSKKLSLGKDYTVTYHLLAGGSPGEAINPATKAAAGTSYAAVISATETGCFSGTMNDHIVIKTIDPKDKGTVPVSKLTVKIPNQKWTGNVIDVAGLFSATAPATAPVATVANGRDALTCGTDYTVECGECKDAGEYLVTIRGTEGKAGSQKCYIGIKKVKFKVEGTSANKVKVACLNTSPEYKGRPLTLSDLYVVDKTGYTGVTLYKTEGKTNTALNAGDDYTVEMSNTGALGRFDLIFKLRGGYTGEIKKTINVKAYDFGKDNAKILQITPENAVYNKAGARPGTVVKFGDKQLREGVDYTLAYKNNTMIATDLNAKKVPIVEISGIGNFKGKASAKFRISKAPVSQIKLSLTDKEYKQNQSKGYYRITPKLVDNGKNISNKKDIKDIGNNPYKFCYADSGKEISSDAKNVDLNRPIMVKVYIEAADDSPYYGKATITGTYRLIEKSKNIGSATITVLNDEVFTFSGDEDAVMPKASDFKVVMKRPDRSVITLTAGNEYKLVSVTGTRTSKEMIFEFEGCGSYGGRKTLKVKTNNRKMQ